MPLLSVPLLAGGDSLDNTSVRWLLKAALKKKKEEEEEERKVQERKEGVMQDIHRKIHANEDVSEAEWAAWKAWRGIGSSSSGGQKRKRKKRRKRKLPRNSSCPRLAARHLGRYGPEGHLCRDTDTASVARVVRTWKPGLSTSHWHLAPSCSVPDTPEEHRKIWTFLGDHYAEIFRPSLISGSHLCGVFYVPLFLTVTCSSFALGLRVYGFFWKMTSGMLSVCSTPWFDSGFMLGVSLRGLMASTLQITADSPQLQFIKGRRHPCLYAFTIPYGSVCSENHRDSPVARRHDGRCPFRAGCTGSHVQVVGGTVVLPQFLLVEKIVVSY